MTKGRMIWPKDEARTRLQMAWANIKQANQWTVLILAVLALAVRSRLVVAGVVLTVAGMAVFQVATAPVAYQPTPSEADFDRAAAQVVRDQVK